MKFRNVLITIIIAVTILLIFLNLGNFLVVNENPIKSDVIIVLAGDNVLRTDYGVILFEKNYSNKLLFTGLTPTEDNKSAAVNMEKQAINLGVSQKNLILEAKAISTYENAVFSKKLLIKNGYKSAIVVTSDYHMRRSRLVFNKAFKDTGIRLTFCNAKDKNFTPTKWWTNSYSVNIVQSEYLKLMGYFVEGRL